jgi:hypothetical protein
MRSLRSTMRSRILWKNSRRKNLAVPSRWKKTISNTSGSKAGASWSQFRTQCSVRLPTMPELRTSTGGVPTPRSLRRVSRIAGKMASSSRTPSP